MIGKTRKPQPRTPVVAIDNTSVSADVPVAGPASEVACRLCLQYRTDDPLVVTLAVQAPSRAVVCERTMLRRDLRATLTRTIGQDGLVAGPAEQPALVQFVFIEHRTSIGMLVPRRLLEDFLGAAGTLVAWSEEAETQALGRALLTLT